MENIEIENFHMERHSKGERQPSKHFVYLWKTHTKQIVKTPMISMEEKENRVEKWAEQIEQKIHKGGYPNDK